MSSKPLFSIIIPLYNKGNTISNTLTSVLKQSYVDYEVIIINDGSTDHSEEIVLNFNDKRIHYFFTKNNGVSIARNLGIEKANGKLIAFLDADDYWYPNHLEILSQLYQKFPDAGLYTTSYEKRFNSKATFTANFNKIDSQGKSFMLVEDFFDSSLIDVIAWTSACAVPKNILDTIGVFDTSITHGAGEDTDLWIRIALTYEVALATYVTATYILDANNRISNTNTLKRNFMDLNKFNEEEIGNQSLKRYLDQNRYAISLLYKSAGDHETAKKYKKEIDYKNLNTKQKILLAAPKFLYNFLKTIKSKLILNAGIKLSAFE
ncbi:glycosyltransferase family 2 protein [uncultured Aquimarina sp.]|uniref:glycosyltransferase family 2 protein n=1 Tax=uncultured Aquimarina sp. TaxID=575652 RepID=UPI0026250D9B|nr:glycosyltransferase family 2 protein [uncultured Aquimarina sp.]